MNQQQLRTEWIARLRSGKYKQVFGNLHVLDEGYCCLGVACEILAEEGVLTVTNSRTDDHHVRYDGHGGLLPPAAIDAFGMISQHGTAPAAASLTSLNDGHFSFSEIADALETGIYWAADA